MNILTTFFMFNYVPVLIPCSLVSAPQSQKTETKRFVEILPFTHKAYKHEDFLVKHKVLDRFRNHANVGLTKNPNVPGQVGMTRYEFAVRIDRSVKSGIMEGQMDGQPIGETIEIRNQIHSSMEWMMNEFKPELKDLGMKFPVDFLDNEISSDGFVQSRLDN